MKTFEHSTGQEISYEVFGNRKDPVIVLIQGLGMQMMAWPEDFCKKLAGSGYCVVRFDNRDVGLSRHFTELGCPSAWRLFLSANLQDGRYESYSLRDMAKDVVLLMDHLEVDEFHVVGVSMGGMIAQWLAIDFAHRVKSLNLLMTSSGHKDLPGPSFKVRLALMARASVSNPLACEAQLEKVLKALSGKHYRYENEELKAFVHQSVARSYDAEGVLRQLQAIVSDKSRTDLLGRIVSPTLIIHGREDKMLPFDNAIDLSHRIQNSKLKIVEGLGHVISREYSLMLADDLLAFLNNN